jgi:hypothetical protein
MAILTTLLAAAGPSVAKILLKKFLAFSDAAQIFGEELTEHPGRRPLSLGLAHRPPVARPVEHPSL